MPSAARKKFDANLNDIKQLISYYDTVMANFAGSFGSSDEVEFITQEAFTNGDLLLDRFQLARLQRLFSDEESPGKWTLFMKVDGQFANDSLVSSLRKFAGGASSVRGYREQDISGDDGIVATLELRTPLLQNFIPGLARDEEYMNDNPDAWQQHRLQFVAFADWAHVSRKQPLPGELEDKTITGAGVGLLVAARSSDAACVVSYDAWLTNPFRYSWDRMRRAGNNWLSWEEFCNQPVADQLAGLMKRSIVHHADQIQCPLQLFIGGAYEGSVFHESHADFIAQLKKHKKTFTYDIVPDGGHNFVLYYNSTPARYAFRKHMVFLREHIPPASPGSVEKAEQ